MRLLAGQAGRTAHPAGTGLIGTQDDVLTIITRFLAFVAVRPVLDLVIINVDGGVDVSIFTFNAGCAALLTGTGLAVDDMAAAVDFLLTNGTGVPALGGVILPAVAVYGVLSVTGDTSRAADGAGSRSGTSNRMAFKIQVRIQMVGASLPVAGIIVVESIVIVAMAEFATGHIGSAALNTSGVIV